MQVPSRWTRNGSASPRPGRTNCQSPVKVSGVEGPARLPRGPRPSGTGSDGSARAARKSYRRLPAASKDSAPHGKPKDLPWTVIMPVVIP
jgi:hypothetical protein